MRLRAEPILYSLMAFPSIGIHVLHALRQKKRRNNAMHGVERLPSKVGHCVIPKDTTGALMLREFFFEVKERQREMLCAYKNMHLECI